MDAREYFTALFSDTRLSKLETSLDGYEFYLVCDDSPKPLGRRQGICVKSLRLVPLVEGLIGCKLVRDVDTECACSPESCSIFISNERAKSLARGGKFLYKPPYSRQPKPWLEVDSDIGKYAVALGFRRNELFNEVVLISWKISPFDAKSPPASCKFYRTQALNRLSSFCESELGLDRKLPVQWAQAAIRECVKHDLCKKSTKPHIDPKELPRRLIMITDDPNGLELKLVEISHPREGLTYLTLSHCWGEDAISAKLTSKNRTAYMFGFSADCLPKTFRHALEFTAILGYEYLWIDALCIIQDDLDDWAEEAPRMATIYNNGFVNLAAASSRDPEGGLFIQDYRAVGEQLYLPWAELEHHAARSKVWGGNGWTYHAEILKSPLSKRAWVLQEQYMAPRTIHFTEAQLWWECRKYCRNEYESTARNEFYSLKRANQDYLRLVSTFSARSLSRPSDRLVAFSAIARDWASRRGYDAREYLAGLWKPDLIRQLLWYVTNAPTQSGTEFIAPSWSWASIGNHGGLLRYTYQFEDKRAFSDNIHMIDAMVKYKNDDPFSLAISGHLDMRCVLHLIHVRSGQEKCRIISIDGEAVQDTWHIQIDRLIDTQIRICFLLPLTSQEGGNEGLVLTPVDEVQCEFRRIGYSYWFWHTHGDSFVSSSEPAPVDFRDPGGRIFERAGAKSEDLRRIRII